MQHLVSINDMLHRIWLGRTAHGYAIHVGDACWPVSLEDGSVLRFDGAATPVTVAADGDRIHVHIDGAAYELVIHDAVAFHKAEAGGEAHSSIRAPMPGSVVALAVKSGDAVAAGDVLMVIESMKLETTLKASHDCVVEAVNFTIGQSFERDAVLITFTMPED
jgi:acetyl/propionyl-CoA carboxylase alpha subunit